MKIKIIPKCQRARNRIREHGEIMTLLGEGMFRSQSAILVESLDKTWSGEKWGGWFTSEEVSFEKIAKTT